ncbi:hypothetical protein BLOT_014090 [Blomia tropicalis]|nr:hypothetical protein BLOT_014090 [Blomia tropicalis]
MIVLRLFSTHEQHKNTFMFILNLLFKGNNSFVPFVSVELSRIISILDFDPWKKMNESNEQITSKFLM